MVVAQSNMGKGLLYKGHKVVPYCPRCVSLSSHEVAQGYEEVEDPSIYVKVPVVDHSDTYFLVWTILHGHCHLMLLLQ